MPEVPLWKIKIDGQEYPPPQEGDETEVPTPRDEDEMPPAAAGLQEWYESRRKEYEAYLSSPEASLLESATEAFLANPSKKEFLASLRKLRGPGSWQVLRIFFDKCTDSTLVDQAGEALWKQAIEWLLHENHRKITMVELNDLARNMDLLDRSPSPPNEEENAQEQEPEFDENFRFIERDEDL